MMTRVEVERMLARAIALVILLATQLRAVDSDFRAGLWEGTIERGRGIDRIVLLLTISVQARDSANPATSAWARVESNSGICGSNKPDIEPNRVSFECMTWSKRGEAEFAAGHFEGYFSPRSNLVTGTWRGEPIQLARPKQTDSPWSEGDWVAAGAGHTCVVRFFDGNGSRLMNGAGATIDIYSKERAVFGKQLYSNALPRGSNRPNFWWDDTDKNIFSGQLTADNSELSGGWQGRDFLCVTPDHRITFLRARSSL
jgi:hypothetical protein